MKNETCFKKFVRIIAGGVTGAFLLTGISAILTYVVIVLMANVPWMGKIFFIKEWTLEGNYAVIIAAGIAGFIAGSIKSNSSIIQTWRFAAFVFLIPMVLGLWLFYGYASHVEIPQKIKITDCSNRVVRTHFKFPKGRNYHLIIATASSPTNAFSGEVHITCGTLDVVDFPIQPEQVTWLNIMPFEFNLTGPALYQFIHPQTNYEIQMDFDQPPPPSTSLWLYWLQAYKDRDK
ncbi:MAG: hypothetical protein ACREFE_14610 [Limisphaerales bacterium]